MCSLIHVHKRGKTKGYLIVVVFRKTAETGSSPPQPTSPAGGPAWLCTVPVGWPGQPAVRRLLRRRAREGRRGTSGATAVPVRASSTQAPCGAEVPPPSPGCLRLPQVFYNAVGADKPPQERHRRVQLSQDTATHVSTCLPSSWPFSDIRRSFYFGGKGCGYICNNNSECVSCVPWECVWPPSTPMHVCTSGKAATGRKFWRRRWNPGLNTRCLSCRQKPLAAGSPSFFKKFKAGCFEISVKLYPQT